MRTIETTVYLELECAVEGDVHDGEVDNLRAYATNPHKDRMPFDVTAVLTEEDREFCRERLLAAHEAERKS